MKRKFFVIVSTLSIFALLALSQIKNKPFAPAEDFPRGALVYVQINDLPAAVKLWNESNFKEKYLASENFADFQNNHLGRKLASRWQEFNEAAGFEFDLETVAKLLENKAAFALYDVGKLEFVFITPVSDEIFAAAKFVQNKEKFTEETLEDSATIYRATVEADRGRQRQELIFTNLKGRFVLATSEKLLAQTLKNINGDRGKNRLSDEPSFKELSEKIEPHLATVWINQQALSDDYYFRRYWLMSDGADLKNIRAGVFDFEIGDRKIFEHRKFLLDQPENISALNPKTAGKMLSFIPAKMPFYSLQTANPKLTDEAIQQTIFDRRGDVIIVQSKHKFRYSSYDYSDDYDWHDYTYLDEKFDENVNESEEDNDFNKTETEINFAKFFENANPQAVLTFTEPALMPAPFFVEFRRAAIFHLAAPDKFNRNEFEAAIAETFSQQVLINASETGFAWQSKNENGLNWRELNLPMTDWNASYAVRGNELILTNDKDFLREILEAKSIEPKEIFEKSFAGLKVVNFERRDAAFDQIFGEFAEKKIADSFFTGNIKSLLDSIAEIRKIEVSKRFTAKLLEEEVIAYLK